MPFAPGDHLRVHRKRFGLPYTHHAINVGDGRVVEFGGSTANKPAMGIEYSAYEQFAKGDVVDVVLRLTTSDAGFAPRRMAHRVSTAPPVRRDRVQLRARCAMVLNRLGDGEPADTPQAVWRAGRVDRSSPPTVGDLDDAGLAADPAPVLEAIFIYVGWSLWTHFQYDNGIRHFVKHIRENCPRELREASAPA